MNTVAMSATSVYLEAIRAELTDLPADEVTEILDDLAGHLEQVCEELGGEPTFAQLEDRLGSATHYAAELRAAAGFTDLGLKVVRPRRFLRWLVTWFMRAGVLMLVGAAAVSVQHYIVARPYPDWAFFTFLLTTGLLVGGLGAGLWLLAHGGADPVRVLAELPDAIRARRWATAAAERLRARPWGRGVVELVAGLRPAWWIVRAWVATQLVAGTMAASYPAFDFPLPRHPLSWPLLAVAITISVWLGLRASSGGLAPWTRIGLGVGNLVGALFAMWVALAVSAGATAELLRAHELRSAPADVVSESDPPEVVAEIEVPDVVGRSAWDALDVLVSRGFEVDVDEQALGADWPVSSQVPESGSIVPEGTVVALVADGLLEVPTVVGLLLEDAITELSRAEFIGEVQADAEDDWVVVDQFPPGGQLTRHPSVTLVAEPFEGED
jgi:hypothetical protein